MSNSALRCVFFFFQAEDGIRDLYVTGVQTCALPIWSGAAPRTPPRSGRRTPRDDRSGQAPAAAARQACATTRGPAASYPGGVWHAGRSEERRVGKGVDRGVGREGTEEDD